MLVNNDAAGHTENENRQDTLKQQTLHCKQGAEDTIAKDALNTASNHTPLQRNACATDRCGNDKYHVVLHTQCLW